MSGPVCTQKPVHDLGNMLVSMDFTGTNPGHNIIVKPSGDHTMCTKGDAATMSPSYGFYTEHAAERSNDTHNYTRPDLLKYIQGPDGATRQTIRQAFLQPGFGLVSGSAENNSIDPAETKTLSDQRVCGSGQFAQMYPPGTELERSFANPAVTYPSWKNTLNPNTGEYEPEPESEDEFPDDYYAWGGTLFIYRRGAGNVCLHEGTGTDANGNTGTDHIDYGKPVACDGGGDSDLKCYRVPDCPQATKDAGGRCYCMGLDFTHGFPPTQDWDQILPCLESTNCPDYKGNGEFKTVADGRSVEGITMWQFNSTEAFQNVHPGDLVDTMEFKHGFCNPMPQTDVVAATQFQKFKDLQIDDITKLYDELELTVGEIQEALTFRMEIERDDNNNDDFTCVYKNGIQPYGWTFTGPSCTNGAGGTAIDGYDVEIGVYTGTGVTQYTLAAGDSNSATACGTVCDSLGENCHGFFVNGTVCNTYDSIIGADSRLDSNRGDAIAASYLATGDSYYKCGLAGVTTTIRVYDGSWVYDQAANTLNLSSNLQQGTPVTLDDGVTIHFPIEKEVAASMWCNVKGFSSCGYADYITQGAGGKFSVNDGTTCDDEGHTYDGSTGHTCYDHAKTDAGAKSQCARADVPDTVSNPMTYTLATNAYGDAKTCDVCKSDILPKYELPPPMMPAQQFAFKDAAPAPTNPQSCRFAKFFMEGENPSLDASKSCTDLSFAGQGNELEVNAATSPLWATLPHTNKKACYVEGTDGTNGQGFYWPLYDTAANCSTAYGVAEADCDATTFTDVDTVEFTDAACFTGGQNFYMPNKTAFDALTDGVDVSPQEIQMGAQVLPVDIDGVPLQPCGCGAEGTPKSSYTAN